MTPRKAFIIGNVMVAFIGTLMTGSYGYPIYQWLLTGEFWFIDKQGHFAVVTYGKSPISFSMIFGMYALITAVGLACLGAAIFNPIYYWKKLFGR